MCECICVPCIYDLLDVLLAQKLRQMMSVLCLWSMLLLVMVEVLTSDCSISFVLQVVSKMLLSARFWCHCEP